ncbi:MAG: hypothetical protein ABI120_12405 [Gemmatimonadaceae bacterium]
MDILQNVLRRTALVATSVVAVLTMRASVLPAQNTPELSSLDMWIVQRYRGAHLLPDSGARGTATYAQAGAPRIESTRSVTRRDTVVALHFGAAMWRPSMATTAVVQLADPSGTVSGIAGKVTARRAFRAPRIAGARDTVPGEWRIGWAYLVAIPARVANASASGFSGWALAETPPRASVKVGKPALSDSKKEPRVHSSESLTGATSAATQLIPPAALPPIR